MPSVEGDVISIIPLRKESVFSSAILVMAREGRIFSTGMNYPWLTGETFPEGRLIARSPIYTL